MNEADDLPQLVREAADLDGWASAEAITSNKGAVCPHCEKLVSNHFLRRDGYAMCQHCGVYFGWLANGSPIGFAFTTWPITNEERKNLR